MLYEVIAAYPARVASAGYELVITAERQGSTTVSTNEVVPVGVYNTLARVT